MILRPMMRLFTVVSTTVILSCSAASAFQFDGEKLHVTQPETDVSVVVGSSQPITFSSPIPKIMVQVPEVVDASPVAENEILVTGLKPGISKLTAVDEDGTLYSLTIEVKLDVRILQRAIDKIFPTSQIRVEALSSQVILSGYVADSEHVTNIMALASDYFPVGVINNMRVSKSPNVAIQVKIYEVSRTKLRRLGVDWAYFGENFNLVSNFSELIQSVAGGTATSSGDTFAAAVFNSDRNIQVFIEALEQHNVAKLLDEPTLVAKDGRPAEFLSGGEIPFQVQAGLGNNTIEFRPFGTKLDIVPIVLGQNRLTLEVRAEVSEVDAALGTDVGVPGFRVRRVNTAVDMPVGHTLALAGDYREDIVAEKRGAPKLLDHPFWGAAFRKTEETVAETELVFLLTPRFIDAVAANQVKQSPIGRSSASPSDRDLFRNAHIEVPTCENGNCPVPDAFRNAVPGPRAGQAVPNGGAVVTPPAGGSWSRSALPSGGSSTRSGNPLGGFSWPSK